MSKHNLIVLAITATFLVAMTAVARGKHQTKTSETVAVASAVNPSSSSQASPPQQQPPDPQAASASQQASVAPAYGDPPSVDVGLTVEQAYAGIPHRRTVWNDSESTVPEEEKAYLRTMFQVIDQAIAVRVAGLQSFSNKQFDSINIDANWESLISFTQEMTVPKTLTSYHQNVLAAFSNERQFFSEWRSRGDQFEFARQFANHSGVRAASSASRAAYGELMARYPSETQNNKDAFYDYHCALDFL